MSETLSLTNEPNLLLNAALDALAAAMTLECCWLQTSDSGGLTLAAWRGLDEEMRAEVAALRVNGRLGGEVIGQGHDVVIPDLSRDGVYGLDSFQKAGLRWVVAVPLMTHRAHGILGAASPRRKLYDRDTVRLLRVTGELIGAALVKARADRPGLRPPRREPDFQRHHRLMAAFRRKHG